MNETGKTLLAIEEALWIGGPDVYRRHVDETCLTVFPSMAAVYPREEIAVMAKDRRWRNVALDVKGMVEPEPGMAILTYQARATRENGEPYEALVSSGYVARGDGWKLVFHQQTEIDATAEKRKPAAA
jgi:hypothetical protein